LARHFSLLRFAILGCISGLLVLAPMAAQQSAPAAQSAPEPNFRCPHRADPHRRSCVCNDEDFDWDETLARGWNDIRQVLKHIGITPTASYSSALQTNVTGGQHQVWSYAGQLSFAVSADLNELLKAPGLSAYAGISWGTGGNLAASLDSPISTSSFYAPSFYLGQMYLQQRLLQSKLTILAGRLAASNGFASLPVFANYVTYGIDPNPASLGANDVTFFGPPPGSEWGAQATYTITSTIQVAAGAFNTNLNSANGENHGTFFTLQQGNKGALAIGEVNYLRNQESSSHGMPGQFTVGFLHTNNSFPLLNNPLNHSDGYSGVYVMGQQVVYRPGGPGTSQGATVWGTWTYTSKDLISPVPLFWGSGLSYTGLIPARKNDVVSLGLVRAEASVYVPALGTEQVLELNYQWVHSRYLTITPHGQYLWLHNNSQKQNATVLGIQLAITL